MNKPVITLTGLAIMIVHLSAAATLYVSLASTNPVPPYAD